MRSPHSERTYGAERLAAEGLPNVTTADLTDNVCLGRVCNGTRDGLILYRDDHHITGALAEALSLPLAAHIKALLSDRFAAVP